MLFWLGKMRKIMGKWSNLNLTRKFRKFCSIFMYIWFVCLYRSTRRSLKEMHPLSLSHPLVSMRPKRRPNSTSTFPTQLTRKWTKWSWQVPLGLDILTSCPFFMTSTWSKSMPLLINQVKKKKYKSNILKSKLVKNNDNRESER